MIIFYNLLLTDIDLSKFIKYFYDYAIYIVSLYCISNCQYVSIDLEYYNLWHIFKMNKYMFGKNFFHIGMSH